MRGKVLYLGLLLLSGCGGEIEDRIKEPGPAPPYNPKGAAVDPDSVKKPPVDTDPPAPASPQLNRLRGK